MSRLGVSVIIPVNDPGASVAELYHECAPALISAGFDPEFLLIGSPPHQALLQGLDQLRWEGAPVRVLQVAQPSSTAMLTRVGVAEARHEVLLLLPGRRRVVAEILPDLVSRVADGVDAVVAERITQGAGLLNRLQRRLFHLLARPVTRGVFHDLGCGVVAVRRDALAETPVYGDFLRFLPLLLEREGFTVVEIATPQHPADDHPRIYGPVTWLRGAVDVLGMYFLGRFTERPLRFFGLIGLLLATAGGLLLAALLVQRIEGVGIANRPALLAGTLLLVLGVQAIALGLVAEIIVHLSAPGRRPYRLAGPARPDGAR